MMNQHPNATVAGGTGLVTTVILWIADKEHWTIPMWVAAAIATGVIATVLFIGRNGVAGAWNRLMHGPAKPPAAPPAPPV
jgi:hypothetical protein